jgi:hypothetical protein
MEVSMSQDVLELLENYRSGDMVKSAKLASTLHWRRLQLLLLGEILIELRRLNEKLEGAAPHDSAVYVAPK